MTTSKKLNVLLAGIFITLLLACGNPQVYEIAENDNDAKELEAVIDESIQKSVPGFGKSNAESEWKRLFRKCNSSALFKNPKYVGMSILNTIGTVVNLRRKEIKRFHISTFSSQDSSNIIVVGNPQNLCSIDMDTEFSFNLLLQPIIQGIGDAEVKVEIENSKNRKLTGGSYREVAIATDAFKEWVNSNATNEYKTSIKEKGAVFVGKYLWVDKFNMEVTIADSSKIEAKLATAAEINEQLSLGGSLKIQPTANKKTIKIVAENAMVPLVGFYKYED